MLKIRVKFVTRYLTSKDFYNLLIIKIAIISVLTMFEDRPSVYPYYISELSQQVYGARC